MNFTTWGTSLAGMKREHWPRGRDDSSRTEETWFERLREIGSARLVVPCSDPG
jgi:hypothetical protein